MYILLTFADTALTLDRMRPSTKSLLAGCLLIWASCAVAEPTANTASHPVSNAAPAAPVVADVAPLDPDDAVASLLAKKGLLVDLQGWRQSVGSAASGLVANAMNFLGVPYKWGGTSAETGFDCSGFVRAIYEQSVGLVLPRRAAEQAEATRSIAQDELRPGDLVFFNTMQRAFSHVGIYVGDGKFIHSPRAGSHVRVEDMKLDYWAKRYNGARRVDIDASSPASLRVLR